LWTFSLFVFGKLSSNSHLSPPRLSLSLSLTTAKALQILLGGNGGDGRDDEGFASGGVIARGGANAAAAAVDRAVTVATVATPAPFAVPAMPPIVRDDERYEL
jgi:hypothetical protein